MPPDVYCRLIALRHAYGATLQRTQYTRLISSRAIASYAPSPIAFDAALESAAIHATPLAPFAPYALDSLRRRHSCLMLRCYATRVDVTAISFDTLLMLLSRCRHDDALLVCCLR